MWQHENNYWPGIFLKCSLAKQACTAVSKGRSASLVCLACPKHGCDLGCSSVGAHQKLCTFLLQWEHSTESFTNSTRVLNPHPVFSQISFQPEGWCFWKTSPCSVPELPFLPHHDEGPWIPTRLMGCGAGTAPLLPSAQSLEEPAAAGQGTGRRCGLLKARAVGGIASCQQA